VREIDVALRQPARVVRGQQNVDPVPHIRPFGVMIGLFGGQRHAGHERKGFGEIGEQEPPRQRIACLVKIPLAKPVERGRALRFIELFDHCLSLHACFPYVAFMGSPRQRPETYAPDAATIEALARATLAGLPDTFRVHLQAVVVQVHDWPDEALLAEMAIDDPLDLTGVYLGRPVGDKHNGAIAAMPDMIQLFRMPMLFEWAETGVALEHLVAHVTIHEIGHHFGLSDADMAALEDAALEDGA